ncbi:hypothetical protein BC829DRAFT_384689 [Chytridium lagenaria]|nr:hypothetical protein BC829DRAFT_384689 [Chytridium lagenaria]
MDFCCEPCFFLFCHISLLPLMFYALYILRWASLFLGIFWEAFFGCIVGEMGFRCGPSFFFGVPFLFCFYH